MGFRPRAVRVFRPIHGIATVWLQHPAWQGPLLEWKFHARALMTKESLLVANDDATIAQLNAFAAAVPKGSRVPSRLVTCEVWDPKPRKKGKTPENSN